MLLFKDNANKKHNRMTIYYLCVWCTLLTKAQTAIGRKICHLLWWLVFAKSGASVLIYRNLSLYTKISPPHPPRFLSFFCFIIIIIINFISFIFCIYFYLEMLIFNVPEITSSSISLSGDVFLELDQAKKTVKSNVFSWIGHCTNCSKPWSFMTSIQTKCPSRWLHTNHDMM